MSYPKGSCVVGAQRAAPFAENLKITQKSHFLSMSLGFLSSA